MTTTSTAASLPDKDTILAIPADMPSGLFDATDEEGIKAKYRDLCRVWHPLADHGDADAAKVFAHISTLYKLAKARLGISVTAPGAETLRIAATGKVYNIKYRRRHVTDTGFLYTGDQLVTYHFTPDNEDLAKAARKNIAKFSYANAAMEKECARYLPKMKAFLETKDGAYLIIEKTPDLILLRDVLDYCKGKMDPRHAAWVINSLLNLGCYLSWAGMTHNAISLDSYFISPRHHSGALLGGWEFAAPIGAKLAALPHRSQMIASSASGDVFTADPKLDQKLIRALGRELMGDPSGIILRSDKHVPHALAHWLCEGAAHEAAVKVYKKFDASVLKAAFGPKKFVKWEAGAKEIYSRGK
ncbi:MAG: hypothetical protein AB7G80_07590 [Dongiaceae bacterium]